MHYPLLLAAFLNRQLQYITVVSLTLNETLDETSQGVTKSKTLNSFNHQEEEEEEDDDYRL